MKSTTSPAPLAKRQRNAIIGVIAIAIVAFLLSRCLGLHENPHEQVARGVTLALQNNDLVGVQKYQNAETATQVTRARVGRAADALIPLGKLKSVKQTSGDDSTRVYGFQLTFDKGTVQEQIKFDPDGKIVGFRYDAPVPKT